MTPAQLGMVLLLSSLTSVQTPSTTEIQNVYSDAHALYIDLHEHPELSGHEVQTSTKLAEPLRAAGYEKWKAGL